MSKTPEHYIVSNDGVGIHLGDEVWINHHSAIVPCRCTLIGIRLQEDDGEDWPWIVVVKNTDGTTSQYSWAHVYAEEQAAIKADPWPTIQRLRHDLERARELARTLAHRSCVTNEEYEAHPWLEVNDESRPVGT